MKFQSQCPKGMFKSKFEKKIYIPQDRIEASWERLQKKRNFR